MSYGVEIVANNGNKFVIPDYNPFVFYGKFSLSGGGTRQINTGIPAHVRVLVFKRVKSYSVTGLYMLECSHFVANGVWYVGMNDVPYYVDFYVFTNVELNNVRGPSSYGIEVRDAGGNLIVGNNSRLLKARIETPPYTPYDLKLNYHAAVASSVTMTYPGGYNPYVSDFGGYLVSMSQVDNNGDLLSFYYMPTHNGPEDITGGSTYFPNDALCINIADYDQAPMVKD